MKQIEVEALAEALPVVAVVHAWQVFKRTHDIQDAKHCCCEHTLKLFRELEVLEHTIVGIAREVQ